MILAWPEGECRVQALGESIGCYNVSIRIGAK